MRRLIRIMSSEKIAAKPSKSRKLFRDKEAELLNDLKTFSNRQRKMKFALQLCQNKIITGDPKEKVVLLGKVIAENNYLIQNEERQLQHLREQSRRKMEVLSKDESNFISAENLERYLTLQKKIKKYKTRIAILRGNLSGDSAVKSADTALSPYLAELHQQYKEMNEEINRIAKHVVERGKELDRRMERIRSEYFLSRSGVQDKEQVRRNYAEFLESKRDRLARTIKSDSQRVAKCSKYDEGDRKEFSFLSLSLDRISRLRELLRSDGSCGEEPSLSDTFTSLEYSFHKKRSTDSGDLTGAIHRQFLGADMPGQEFGGTETLVAPSNYFSRIKDFRTLSMYPDWDVFFTRYLESCFAAENIHFLKAAVEFRRLYQYTGPGENVARFVHIYNTFIKEGAAQEINIEYSSKERLSGILAAIKGCKKSSNCDRHISHSVFDPEIEGVIAHLDNNSIHPFTKSSHFGDFEKHCISYEYPAPVRDVIAIPKKSLSEMDHKVLNAHEFYGIPRDPLIVIDDLSSSLQTILKAYYSDGRVDLTQVQKSLQFKKWLRLLSELRKVKLERIQGQRDTTVFFLNLFNMMTLHLWISKGMIYSDSKSRSVYKYKIGKLLFGLDDIRHGILRGDIFRMSNGRVRRYYEAGDDRARYSIRSVDPRVHFAMLDTENFQMQCLFVATRENLGKLLSKCVYEKLNSEILLREPLLLPKFVCKYYWDFGVREDLARMWLTMFVDDTEMNDTGCVDCFGISTAPCGKLGATGKAFFRFFF